MCVFPVPGHSDGGLDPGLSFTVTSDPNTALVSGLCPHTLVFSDPAAAAGSHDTSR